MQEKIRQIVAEAREALEKADNTAALEALRVQFQGKKGSLTQLLRGMGSSAPKSARRWARSSTPPARISAR